MVSFRFVYGSMTLAHQLHFSLNKTQIVSFLHDISAQQINIKHSVVPVVAGKHSVVLVAAGKHSVVPVVAGKHSVVLVAAGKH